ncbi:hypothetical protein CL618_01495 [archaeon]|nr:hypothetical protein [archaeon]|tara:strand:+ start:1102 stop:1362 length:261 start_codon:yes stop_codon:yes gene_type:complete
MEDLSEIEQLVLSVVEESPGRWKSRGVVNQVVYLHNGKGTSEKDVKDVVKGLIKEGYVELRGTKRLHGQDWEQFCYPSENGKKEVV